MDAELIAAFKAARTKFEEKEMEYEQAEKEYRVIEEIMWEKMVEDGTSSVRIDGLGTCTKVLKGPYVSLDQNDPFAADELRDWCKTYGYENIFRFQPVMSSLNPIVRDMREKGEPLPPGIKITEHRRIQVLKRKD